MRKTGPVGLFDAEEGTVYETLINGHEIELAVEVFQDKLEFSIFLGRYELLSSIAMCLEFCTPTKQQSEVRIYCSRVFLLDYVFATILISAAFPLQL